MRHRRPLGLPLISWLAGGVALCAFGVILVAAFMGAPPPAPVERADRAPDHDPAPVWEEWPPPAQQVADIEPPAAPEPQGHPPQDSQAPDISQPESEEDTGTSELEPLPELSEIELQQIDDQVELSLGFQFGDFLEKADLPTDIEANAVRLLSEYIQSIQSIDLMVEAHGYDRDQAAQRIRTFEAELAAEMDRILPWRVRPEWQEAWDNRTENLVWGFTGHTMNLMLSADGAAAVHAVLADEMLQRMPKGPAEQIQFNVAERSQWMLEAGSATLERNAQELSDNDYQRFQEYMNALKRLQEQNP